MTSEIPDKGVVVVVVVVANENDEVVDLFVVVVGVDIAAGTKAEAVEPTLLWLL